MSATSGAASPTLPLSPAVIVHGFQNKIVVTDDDLRLSLRRPRRF